MSIRPAVFASCRTPFTPPRLTPDGSLTMVV